MGIKALSYKIQAYPPGLVSRQRDPQLQVVAALIKKIYVINKLKLQYMCCSFKWYFNFKI